MQFQFAYHRLRQKSEERSTINKLLKIARKSRISKRNKKIFVENKKRDDDIKNPKIILQRLNSIKSLLDENEIISLVKKRLNEDSGQIFDCVFSSVMQEIKARGQYLEGGIVDTNKILHPTIEKSHPRKRHGGKFARIEIKILSRSFSGGKKGNMARKENKTLQLWWEACQKQPR